MKDENQNDDGGTADGKIDVEAPSPRHFCCEDTAQQRTDDGGKTKDCTHESL